MRYLASAGMESHESILLRQDFGKYYYPQGDVNMSRDTLMDAPTTALIPDGEEVLAVEPDTASWCYLTAAEGQMLEGLAGGRSLGQLARALLAAFDPDAIEAEAQRQFDLPHPAANRGAPHGRRGRHPGRSRARRQRGDRGSFRRRPADGSILLRGIPAGKETRAPRAPGRRGRGW